MNSPNGLEIAVEVVGADGRGIACVKPIGEVDLSNADEFDAAISSPEVSECAGTLLDLTELDFMDSSGLRVVLSHSQTGGERFATILKDGSAVASLFEMVGVLDRLNLAKSQDEALEKLRAAADGAG